MIEKICIAPGCKAHPCFGIDVSKESRVWACSAHRSMLPPPMFHMKPLEPPAPAAPRAQGSLF